MQKPIWAAPSLRPSLPFLHISTTHSVRPPRTPARSQVLTSSVSSTSRPQPLAYGVDKEAEQKVMVYDLGGGTFDVSILDIGDGVIEVLATNGNTHLGGDDFDECVMNYLVSEFKKAEGIDLSNDKVAMQSLKEAAEKAKIELSGVTSTNINLPYITADAKGPKHLDVTLTRAKFNELTAHLVEATAGPVKAGDVRCWFDCQRYFSKVFCWSAAPPVSLLCRMRSRS